MMEVPDGYVLLFDSDSLGIKINVTEIELIKCKHCKYCIQCVFCGTPFLSCVQNIDAKKEVYENDWCCWGEKVEE